jgi:hypothetical protein
MRFRGVALASLAAGVAAFVALTAGASSAARVQPAGATSALRLTSATTLAPWCKLPPRLSPPKWLPADLPLPAGTYRYQRLSNVAGYHRALFITPASTVDLARFILDEWPANGWTLGRGDAEPGEIEDQFYKDTAAGAFKAADMNCRHPHSRLLLVFNPTAIAPSPSPSPSPTDSPSPSPSASASPSPTDSPSTAP